MFHDSYNTFRTFRTGFSRQENMFHAFLLIFKKLLPSPLRPDRFISMGKKYFGGFKQSFETNVCQEHSKGIYNNMEINSQ